MFDNLINDNSGQAYSLEGLVSALIIITAVVYAVSATAITPLTASTSNKQIEEQNRIVGDDLLDSAADKGTLTDTILYYDTNTEQYYETGPDIAYSYGPPTAFGATLNETLDDNGLAYNIYIKYNTSTGPETAQLVYMGVPSEHAAAATRTVVLYDRMNLTAPGTSGTKLDGADDFYMEDIDEQSPVYNVVQVKIVIWKM